MSSELVLDPPAEPTYIVGRPSPDDCAPLPNLEAIRAPKGRGEQAIRMACVHEMCTYLREGCPPPVAANLCGLTIDEVHEAMYADALVRRLLLRAAAASARELIARVKSGEKVSKPALEVLARTVEGWAPRTQSNLAVQFAALIEELKARFRGAAPLGGDEILRVLLDAFDRHTR